MKERNGCLLALVVLGAFLSGLVLVVGLPLLVYRELQGGREGVERSSRPAAERPVEALDAPAGGSSTAGPSPSPSPSTPGARSESPAASARAPAPAVRSPRGPGGAGPARASPPPPTSPAGPAPRPKINPCGCAPNDLSCSMQCSMSRPSPAPTRPHTPDGDPF